MLFRRCSVLCEYVLVLYCKRNAFDVCKINCLLTYLLTYVVLRSASDTQRWKPASRRRERPRPRGLQCGPWIDRRRRPRPGERLALRHDPDRQVARRPRVSSRINAAASYDVEATSSQRLLWRRHWRRSVTTLASSPIRDLYRGAHATNVGHSPIFIQGFRVGMGDCGVQAQNVGNSQNFTTCFGDVHTVFPY